jgi:pimeloyl-ACP methyl ester carboxylesterase
MALRVVELNDGSGTPVVCLHGWLDHSMAFAPMARARAGRWVGLDQRGFGASEHVGAGGIYHFHDHVADLDALVEHLDQPVHLVGHSMGGTVACMYAGARPSRVASLAVVEGLGTMDDPDTNTLDRTRHFLDDLRKIRAPLRFPTMADGIRRLRQRHGGLDEAHAELLVRHGSRPEGDGFRWSFDPHHLARFPIPFREAIFCQFLEAIEAPTLLIWAEDSFYTEALRTPRIAAIAGVRQVTIPGSHMLPYDSPGLVGDAIESHQGL